MLRLKFYAVADETPPFAYRASFSLVATISTVPPPSMAGLSRSPEPHGEVSNTMTHDGDVSLGHGMGSRSASPQIHDARHEPDRDERLQGLATRSWAELVDLASDRSRCEERLRNIRFNEVRLSPTRKTSIH